MKICLFEDEAVENLHPLTLNKPVYELKCGHMSTLDRLTLKFKDKQFILFVRSYLSEVVKEKYRDFTVNDLSALTGGDVLLVNGRWMYSYEELDLSEEKAVYSNKDLIYMYVKGKTMKKHVGRVSGLRELINSLTKELGEERVEAKVIRYPWDLIKYNSEMISLDFKEKKLFGMHGEVADRVEVIGDEEDVFIGKSSVIQPFVVLDASFGPIFIDEGAVVKSFTSITGPAYVGRETWIVGGKLKSCSIGPVCRVGGEVEESIIHGYSNKYHEGFLGHSYVGKWVNLGALTTNSDLKNDYTTVQVYVGGRFVDSGMLKLGSFIGDHTKTSIGTFLNTGTVIGLMCNVMSTELSPKYIPSFTWYHDGRFTIGSGIRRMIRTARTVMARRGVNLTSLEEELYKYLYEYTRSEREEYIKRSRRK